MDLDQEIMELQVELNAKPKLENQLKDATQSIYTLKEKVQKLRQVLEKEEMDVKKLESVSFSSIWFGFLGSKTEKLSKEKDEFYHAQYDYKMATNAQEEAQKDVELIRGKLKKLQQVEQRLSELVQQKETILLDSDSELGRKLQTLRAGIILNKSMIKECMEARQAGESLVHSLMGVESLLKKARGWGTFDIFGGGLLADLAKHSYINDAKKEVDGLKYKVDRFMKELTDVNVHVLLDINISSTLKFFDFFFDGIFSDLAVQSRINNYLDQIVQERNHIQMIIEDLKTKSVTFEQKVNQLEKDKIQVLNLSTM